jgi:predicted phosphodiesterase
MRILAFSDVHGNSDAVKKLVVGVADQNFDAILFGGDFTNAYFDGIDEGNRQMSEIVPLLESLNRPFFFVYGNRDFTPVNHTLVECPIGSNIDARNLSFDKFTFTSNTKGLDKSKILVTHVLSDKLRFTQVEALLYLYGHDHVGRIYKNYLDLGFLYRGTEAHGAHESLFGCYWFIEISEDRFHIENHSWQLKESKCPIHSDQGVFYIPYYWKKDCTLCYDEEENRFHF